ncbi:hypothetical protein TEA_012249 [Camellia sinensis var. sinensis]|uniref:ASCH domain-containing protein n=1 Tax=Camellia sinensis var. sinensis TaxID=542762 RepID=A0A4S4DHK1_CAMSN|nr:hypothetical protein TEA_012249 [Camellia sinensis var. sinensis]
MEESHEHDHECDHQPPPSPGVSPDQLKDCIQELLKFTLNGTLVGLDIGLSKDYCSNLLKDDPVSPNPNNTSHTTGFSEGVPTYPLYKLLASALYHSISFATFHRPYDTMALIHDDTSFKQKEDEWIELVVEKGSELLKVLKNVDFELHVQEPFFSQLKDGVKTVEGRCAVGDYNRPSPLDPTLQANPGEDVEEPTPHLPISVKGYKEDVCRYASFSEMLEAESLTKVLPGVKAIEEGVEIYRKFYSEEKERSNGVLAICVTKPAAQPCISLASILSVSMLDLKSVLVSAISLMIVTPSFGLSLFCWLTMLDSVHHVHSYSLLYLVNVGLWCYLSIMVWTVDGLRVTGTELWGSPEAAGFCAYCGNNCGGTSTTKINSSLFFSVESSTLTDGARALAKHVNRSSSKCWGTYGGSDSNKNKLAKDAISHLIAHCCWQNLHIVPPHGVVYEIRIADGYGARWSEDGTKDSLSHTWRMATQKDGSTSFTEGDVLLASSICKSMPSNSTLSE